MFLVYVFLVINFYARCSIDDEKLNIPRIEKITITQDANVFISTDLEPCLEFVADIDFENYLYDSEYKKRIEYVPPERKIYLEEKNCQKIILVRGIGNVSYLVYRPKDDVEEKNIFCDNGFIEEVKKHIESKVASIAPAINKELNYRDQFMLIAGLSFLIRLDKGGSTYVYHNADVPIIKPPQRSRNWQNANYDFSLREWSPSGDCQNVFIKHRKTVVQVDYATYPDYHSCFRQVMFDIELPQKRPFVFNTKKIISGIIIVGFIGIGFYYALQHIYQKKLKRK